MLTLRCLSSISAYCYSRRTEPAPVRRHHRPRPARPRTRSHRLTWSGHASSARSNTDRVRCTGGGVSPGCCSTTPNQHCTHVDVALLLLPHHILHPERELRPVPPHLVLQVLALLRLQLRQLVRVAHQPAHRARRLGAPLARLHQQLLRRDLHLRRRLVLHLHRPGGPSLSPRLSLCLLAHGVAEGSSREVVLTSARGFAEGFAEGQSAAGADVAWAAAERAGGWWARPRGVRKRKTAPPQRTAKTSQ